MLFGYARRSPLVVTAVVLATIVCAKVLTDWIRADDSPNAVVHTMPTIDQFPRVETWPSPPMLVQPDGNGFPTVVMPDTSGMDRVMGPDIAEYARHMWDSDEPHPAKPPSPAGLLATDVRISTARPDTVLDRVADWLGVSTRTLEVNVQGETVPVVLSPEWGVGKDGRVVDTMPSTQDLLLVASILFAAFLAGSLPYAVYRSFTEGSGDWRRSEENGFLFPAAVLTLGVFTGLSYLAGRLSGELVVLGIVVFLTSLKTWRSRLLAYAWVLFGLSAVRLLGTDILPPHPSMAQVYGPMGVRGLDIAILLAGQVAFLAWRILRNVRFGSVVHVHQPSYPLVQDVRVVDRR